MPTVPSQHAVIEHKLPLFGMDETS